MSGGSYDYLYAKDAGDLFYNAGARLEEMATRLAGLGYAEDAAKDAYDVLAIIRTQTVRVDAAMRRLSGVFRAVEWWDSYDSREDAVQTALSEYRGETPDAKEVAA